MNSFSSMLAQEIALGIRVRYPRTGTTGAVVRIEQVAGNQFAELDSTHLLYRTDLLIPAERTKQSTTAIKEDAKEVIRREREFAAGSELQEALKNIDQSCEGGG
ncbi:MAG: DUF2098 domain-containing protein [Methanoregula sp.]